jgi:hypothetical protein
MDPIPFEKVSIEEARAALKKETAPAMQTNWRPARETLTPSNSVLTDEVLKWLVHLPKDIRPHSVAKQYPHIANRIVEAWAYPPKCEKFLDQLLLDQRGDRQGFPIEVAQELMTLKTYFHTHVSPQRVGIWGERIGGYHGTRFNKK